MPFNPGQLNWAALAGLASGNTVGEQFGNMNNIIASQQPQVAQQQQMNKTLAYLQQNNPQLAAQVAAGMPVNEAWRQLNAAKQPKSLAFQKLDDGTYGSWDETTGTFNRLGQAQKPADLPAIADEYNWMKTQGFDGTAQEYQAWKANQSKSGLMVESDGNGGFRMVQGDVSKLPPKLTESQSKDINFLTRATKAEQDLAPVESELTSFAQKRLTGLPYDIGNYMQSPGYQKAQQAGREILAIILRKDSGAAITDQEMDTYGKIYLPQPGDDSATIAAKKESRATAIKALKAGLGPVAPADEAATPDNGVVPYTDFFK